MNDDDDDIPVLRDTVARKPVSRLRPEQVDEICDNLNAAVWVLIDKLLAEALQDAGETLRLQINDRLRDEFPALVEKVLQDKLGT